MRLIAPKFSSDFELNTNRDMRDEDRDYLKNKVGLIKRDYESRIDAINEEVVPLITYGRQRLDGNSYDTVTVHYVEKETGEKKAKVLSQYKELQGRSSWEIARDLVRSDNSFIREYFEKGIKMAEKLAEQHR